jgi:hypothetical protein
LAAGLTGLSVDAGFSALVVSVAGFWSFEGAVGVLTSEVLSGADVF